METFLGAEIFPDRYWDSFSRPNLSRPIPILSKNWEKSQYRKVLRRDVTLCGIGPSDDDDDGDGDGGGGEDDRGDDGGGGDDVQNQL